MLKCMVKMSLMMLMIAPIGLNYAAEQQVMQNATDTGASVTLTKGQYIIDSRHAKPRVEGCIC